MKKDLKKEFKNLTDKGAKQDDFNYLVVTDDYTAINGNRLKIAYFLEMLFEGLIKKGVLNKELIEEQLKLATMSEDELKKESVKLFKEMIDKIGKK